jgi:hypothetical protein
MDDGALWARGSGLARQHPPVDLTLTSECDAPFGCGSPAAPSASREPALSTRGGRKPWAAASGSSFRHWRRARLHSSCAATRRLLVSAPSPAEPQWGRPPAPSHGACGRCVLHARQSEAIDSMTRPTSRTAFMVRGRVHSALVDRCAGERSLPQRGKGWVYGCGRVSPWISNDGAQRFLEWSRDATRQSAESQERPILGLRSRRR